jgi:predicted acylesterase/phospholipase RssA
MTKRAICLAGGGPAAGLHIGVLECLKDRDDPDNRKIDFKVWALSCIGAWVGVVYNQAKEGEELQAINKFFHGVFRDDKSFKGFPINTIFAPDWAGNAEAMLDFILEPRNYRNAFVPRQVMDSFVYTMKAINRRVRSGELFDEGDFNRWTLNHVLAVNPAVRFLTAMIYKSEIAGLARLYYPDSQFLRQIKFDNLYEKPHGNRKQGEAPYILYNAWNLSKKELQLFTNKKPPNTKNHYKPIDAASLCACSALPYIEQTVIIDGETYCEGALRDTVNFERLLEDHNRPGDPLDEIWINRIVDAQQIREPTDLHDALANLCEMFAATVGEDDVRLFKYHVKEDAKKAEEEARKAKDELDKAKQKDKKEREAVWKEKEEALKNLFKGTVVEIKVDSQINFHWSYSNLERGRNRGRIMADAAYRLYKRYKKEKKDPNKVLMIPDDLSEQEIRDELKHLPEEQIRAVLVGHPHFR